MNRVIALVHFKQPASPYALVWQDVFGSGHRLWLMVGSSPEGAFGRMKRLFKRSLIELVIVNFRHSLCYSHGVLQSRWTQRNAFGADTEGGGFQLCYCACFIVYSSVSDALRWPKVERPAGQVSHVRRQVPIAARAG